MNDEVKLLSTEDMLRIMEAAGWTYSEETRDEWANITPSAGRYLNAKWFDPSKGENPRGEGACRTEEENVRHCYELFVAAEYGGVRVRVRVRE